MLTTETGLNLSKRSSKLSYKLRNLSLLPLYKYVT